MTILPLINKKDREKSVRNPNGQSARQSASASTSQPSRQQPSKRARLEPTKSSTKSTVARPSKSTNDTEHRNSDDETGTTRKITPRFSEIAPNFTADPNVAGSSRAAIAEMTLEQIEVEFEQRMLAMGLVIKEMKGDGACLFRAMADQMYGDQEMHAQMRKLCMDYIVSNRDHYADFITEDFDAYVTRKRISTVHGNHVEMQAMAEMFSRPVHVYEYSDQPLNTFQPASGQDNPPLRLSYHGGSVVDPKAPTIGVGLGLPGLATGNADKATFDKVVKATEKSAIEEAMLADKLKATDYEATEKAVQQQVERESYREWLEMQGCHRPKSAKSTKPSRSKSATPSPPYRPATPTAPLTNQHEPMDESASTTATEARLPKSTAYTFNKAPNVSQLIAGWLIDFFSIFCKLFTKYDISNSMCRSAPSTNVRRSAGHDVDGSRERRRRRRRPSRSCASSVTTRVRGESAC